MVKENFFCSVRRICTALSLGLMLALSACSGISIGGGSGNATPTTAPAGAVSAATEQATSIPTVQPTLPVASTPTSVDPSTLLNVNLITNGDAEAGPGANNPVYIEPI